jgi:alkylation response protein AidB-like acyl-CoA dehydrogenase
LPATGSSRRDGSTTCRGTGTARIIFRDVKVPEENLLGKEGIGFKIAMVALDSGRIGIASQSLGIARACLHEAVAYAKTRKQFAALAAAELQKGSTRQEALLFLLGNLDAKAANSVVLAHGLTLRRAHRWTDAVQWLRRLL